VGAAIAVHSRLNIYKERWIYIPQQQSKIVKLGQQRVHLQLEGDLGVGAESCFTSSVDKLATGKPCWPFGGCRVA